MPRPTKLEINLSAIEHNLRLIRSIIGDKVRILPVVKADAYGHGIKQISKKLLECGIDFLGVATVDEAITLKKIIAKNNFDRKNISILVLGAVLPNETGAILKYDIVQTVAAKVRIKIAVLKEKQTTGVMSNQAIKMTDAEQ